MPWKTFLSTGVAVASSVISFFSSCHFPTNAKKYVQEQSQLVVKNYKIDSRFNLIWLKPFRIGCSAMSSVIDNDDTNKENDLW